MAHLYLLYLLGLGVLVVVLLLARIAMLLSRAQEWTRGVDVHTMLIRQERRQQSLPFVGRERRLGTSEHAAMSGRQARPAQRTHDPRRD